MIFYPCLLIFKSVYAEIKKKKLLADNQKKFLLHKTADILVTVYDITVQIKLTMNEHILGAS